MILSFRTDMPGQTVQTQIRLQTVQTQIRLLLEEQSDQGLHCLPFRLHRLDSLLYGKLNSSNFRVITTNVLGVRIFRKFTVCCLRFGAATWCFRGCFNIFSFKSWMCTCYLMNQLIKYPHRFPLKDRQSFPSFVHFVNVTLRLFSLPVGCGFWLWHSLDFSF